MNHYSLKFLIVLISASISYAWNYMEQDQWPETCQRAIAQSPIDINQKSLIKLNLNPIVLRNWDQNYQAKMRNNGHSVRLDLTTNSPVTISGGGLPGEFKLIQFHFHWGSEHTLNGQQKALESHFVAYNTKYETIAEAMKYKNGIAVLAVLYGDFGRKNKNFDPIIDNIPKIQEFEQQVMVKINPFTLLPQKSSGFYRYFGSLTTPNCSDVVVWTIFDHLVPISKDQVQQFASIMDMDGKTLSKNFRAIQPLNGRMVFQINRYTTGIVTK